LCTELNLLLEAGIETVLSRLISFCQPHSFAENVAVGEQLVAWKRAIYFANLNRKKIKPVPLSMPLRKVGLEAETNITG